MDRHWLSILFGGLLASFMLYLAQDATSAEAVIIGMLCYVVVKFGISD